MDTYIDIEHDDWEYDPSWDDDAYREPCWYCGGSGFVVSCFDDICNGLGYCIHGDGDDVCPECHGEGDW
jgi:hypothetical protein